MRNGCAIVYRPPYIHKHHVPLLYTCRLLHYWDKSMASSFNVDLDSIASSTSFLLAGFIIKSFLDAFLSLRPIPIVGGVCIYSGSWNLSTTTRCSVIFNANFLIPSSNVRSIIYIYYTCRHIHYISFWCLFCCFGILLLSEKSFLSRFFFFLLLVLLFIERPVLAIPMLSL